MSDENSTDTSTASPAPLAGIRVLEFSHTIMGPCAGLTLADLGADVIKIEPCGQGDATRHLPGFASGFFATFNRNKRSLAVDLKMTAGQAVLHKLVETADVLLENYGPGTMERLHCGYAELLAINPKLVYLALKGYLGGPLQNNPALDEVVQFQSGLAYMTGPVGQPLRAGASIIDILGASYGVTGVLAALRERESTGRGQRVGSGLFESAAFLMAPHIAGGAATAEKVPPMTARRGAWGIYDVFAVKDDVQLFIGVTSDAQWVRFCDAFKLESLAADERLTTNAQRTGQRSWLIPELARVLEELDFDTVTACCVQADVSWSPVGEPEQLALHPQLVNGNGLIATSLDTAETMSDRSRQSDQVMLPGLPLEFGSDRARSTLSLQPPALGEHSADVLGAAGFSDDAIDKLIKDGVVETTEL